MIFFREAAQELDNLHQFQYLPWIRQLKLKRPKMNFQPPQPQMTMSGRTLVNFSIPSFQTLEPLNWHLKTLQDVRDPRS